MIAFPPSPANASKYQTVNKRDMSNQKKIRVLCVDDHPLIREGIAIAINSQVDMQVAAQASTGQEGIKYFSEYAPDVVLMDLHLPDMTGIDAMIAIYTKVANARIIVLTMFEGVAEIQRALASGARSYMLKSTPPADMADIIRKVYAGKRPIPTVVAVRLAEHFSDEALTEREIEVLRHVSAGNSNKIIAVQLNLSVNTIKGHIKNILSKLGANDRTHAVSIGLRRGLLRE
jgi:DNA-binding NarL/FixJ family response regulator